jgi:protein-S-isoprenylcysteine O-methyltransferase Ste14
VQTGSGGPDRAALRDSSDTLTRLGGWLFRHRTSLPLPVALAILTLRVGEAPPSAGLLAAGVAITALGEALRLWGVRHIGAISRTRSTRLGPLVDTGPFAIVRNPLYIGNIALWAGFALTARLVWLVPVIVVLLGLEYHAIVRWEEQLLEQQRGDEYRAYCARVPRWLPDHRGHRDDRGHRESREDRGHRDDRGHGQHGGLRGWRETLFSERGTLIAIAVGYLLLWIKVLAHV